MLPIIFPAVPLVLIIAALALGVSISTYLLIRDRSKTLEQRRAELEERLQDGKINEDEFLTAKAALYSRFAT